MKEQFKSDKFVENAAVNPTMHLNSENHSALLFSTPSCIFDKLSSFNMSNLTINYVNVLNLKIKGKKGVRDEGHAIIGAFSKQN